MPNILLNGKHERNANQCLVNIVLNLSNVCESYVYNKIISGNSEFFIKDAQCKRIVFMLEICTQYLPRLKVRESGALIYYLKILLVFLACY